MSATRPSVPDALFQASAESASLDLVFIEGFVGETVIGIHDTELHRLQPVTIDVCAGVPHAHACDTDCIADTIDYGQLRQRLLELLAQHNVRLLEALAEQIAQIALHEFHAHWVRVRVAKPHKYEDTAAVGVIIERRRADAAGTASHASATLRLIGAGMVPGDR